MNKVPALLLLDDWKEIIRKAWSIRLMAVAAVLSGAEVALPLIEYALPIPQGIFAALSGIVVAGAFVARLLAQGNLKNG